MFYLSWPGWELYLSRRLVLSPADSTPQPLLLPDVLDPERDFLVIDQLAGSASQLGAGVLNLEAGRLESLPTLVEGIANYGSGQRDSVGSPLLDDRSYLALWAISEFRAWESDQAMAAAASRQKNMWALLKGEEAENDLGAEMSPLSDEAERPFEADSRAVYAWKCWQRLASGLISDSDQIISTIYLPEE